MIGVIYVVKVIGCHLLDKYNNTAPSYLETVMVVCDSCPGITVVMGVIYVEKVITCHLLDKDNNSATSCLENICYLSGTFDLGIISSTIWKTQC